MQYYRRVLQKSKKNISKDLLPPKYIVNKKKEKFENLNKIAKEDKKDKKD